MKYEPDETVLYRHNGEPDRATVFVHSGTTVAVETGDGERRMFHQSKIKPMPDNDPIINTVGELRGELPHPDDRKYALMARKDHLRVYHQSRLSGGEHGDLREKLRERGFEFDGVNFESQFTVWTLKD